MCKDFQKIVGQIEDTLINTQQIGTCRRRHFPTAFPGTSSLRDKEQDIKSEEELEEEERLALHSGADARGVVVAKAASTQCAKKHEIHAAAAAAAAAARVGARAAQQQQRKSDVRTCGNDY